MLQNAIVKEINPDFDEEILIQISQYKLSCFVTYWGSNILEDTKYKVNITLKVLDCLEMYEEPAKSLGFHQIESTFSYIVYGQFDLEKRLIDAGIDIDFDEDEIDLHDFGHLDGIAIFIENKLKVW